jgi:ABC-type transport system involved in multi-copper enzyme maturation permease subunit
MIASQFRLAVRLQRFEVWACVLLVAVIGITALIVRARLDGVGAPVECLTPWLFEDVVIDTARCDPLAQAFFRINNDEAKFVMDAMSVLPFVVGLVLGVGLVGREIEGGTAATVWALAGSRRQWLVGRLVPILAVLLGLLLFAAITSELLAASRVPWQFGRPAFDDTGSHGSSVVLRGVAAFGIALAVGALSGRMLPTILISALLALFVWGGAHLLLLGWVNASAHEINVPSWFNGWYDGGRFIGEAQYYRLPDGTEADRFTDIYALAPADVDPETWVAEEVDVIAVGVHSPDHPGWVMTETAALGTFALVWLGATLAIVERRRPY